MPLPRSRTVAPPRGLGQRRGERDPGPARAGRADGRDRHALLGRPGVDEHRVADSEAGDGRDLDVGRAGRRDQRSTSTAPLWAFVVGAVKVMPVPPAPAVPTVAIVADSWFAPVSIVICWPAEKPVTDATLMLVTPPA